MPLLGLLLLLLLLLLLRLLLRCIRSLCCTKTALTVCDQQLGTAPPSPACAAAAAATAAAATQIKGVAWSPGLRLVLLSSSSSSSSSSSTPHSSSSLSPWGPLTASCLLETCDFYCSTKETALLLLCLGAPQRQLGGPSIQLLPLAEELIRCSSSPVLLRRRPLLLRLQQQQQQQQQRLRTTC